MFYVACVEDLGQHHTITFHTDEAAAIQRMVDLLAEYISEYDVQECRPIAKAILVGADIDKALLLFHSLPDQFVVIYHGEVAADVVEVGKSADDLADWLTDD